MGSEMCIRDRRKLAACDEITENSASWKLTPLWLSLTVLAAALLVTAFGWFRTPEAARWGQPKWPLFLTEAPGEDEVAEFERLVSHMEEKMMGSFSIAENAVWKVAQ